VPLQILLFIAAGIAVGIAIAVIVPATTGGSGGRTVHVTLRVYDGTLRKPGVPCSGGAGYVAIHEGAAWEIVDPVADRRLDRGKLPAGVAVRIGSPVAGAAVEPSACELRFDADLPDLAKYSLVLPDSRPIRFDRSAFGRDAKLELRIPQ
jgi:hypothetical protein